MTSPILPIKISEQRYVTISMGAIWAMAGAMFIGLGLLCVGIRQGQQFIDSFGEFRKSTLAYEQAAVHDRAVVDVRLANLASWQQAADQRRKIRSPSIVDEAAIDDWGRAIQQANLDVVHTDKDKRGLYMPLIIIKPVMNLPEATVIPLPAPLTPTILDPLGN